MPSKNEESSGEKLIYWERQGIDRLCGLYCVNSILQGPFYNEVQLAQIAIELDNQEKNLMMELGTETEDFLKYMAEDSMNVAEDGNYSIQVVSEALKRIAKLEIDLVDVKKTLYGGSNAVNFDEEKAFICNSSTHWFGLRKIEGVWYDLNSTNKYPELMDQPRIMDFLDNCLNFGYLLFAVRGQFPDVNKDLFIANGYNPHQMWFKPDFLMDIHKAVEPKKPTGGQKVSLDDKVKNYDAIVPGQHVIPAPAINISKTAVEEKLAKMTEEFDYNLQLED